MQNNVILYPVLDTIADEGMDVLRSNRTRIGAAGLAFFL